MRLRKELDRFPNFSPQQGIAKLINDFYKANSIPVNLKNLETFENIERQTGSFPRNRETNLSVELQGVTHDTNNWYFTQVFPNFPRRQPPRKGRIWKIPITVSLNHNFTDDEDGIIRRSLPPELWPVYWHPGDPDYYENHLYVPVEATKGEREHARIAVYKPANLEFVGSAELDHNDDDRGPWCAVNPKDGLLYTSSFCDPNPTPGKIFLYVYRPTVTDTSFELNFIDRFELFHFDGSSPQIFRIQGGCFSSSGHLYLSSENPSARQGQISAYDMISGRLIHAFKYDYRPQSPIKEEVEGITVWNTDDMNIDRISGHIHTILLDNELHDDMSFKHFVVSDPSKL